MAIPNNNRTVILTCSIAAITATGAWYGAGLKTRQEFKRVSLSCDGTHQWNLHLVRHDADYLWTLGRKS